MIVRRFAGRVKFTIFVIILILPVLYGKINFERLSANFFYVELLKWNSEPEFSKAEEHLLSAVYWREKGGGALRLGGYKEYTDLFWMRVTDEDQVD